MKRIQLFVATLVAFTGLGFAPTQVVHAKVSTACSVASSRVIRYQDGPYFVLIVQGDPYLDRVVVSSSSGVIHDSYPLGLGGQDYGFGVTGAYNTPYEVKAFIGGNEYICGDLPAVAHPNPSPTPQDTPTASSTPTVTPTSTPQSNEVPCVPAGSNTIVWGNIPTGTIYAKSELVAPNEVAFSWGVTDGITRSDILIENGVVIRNRAFYTNYIHIEHARYGSWFMAWSINPSYTVMWDSRQITSTVPIMVVVPVNYPFSPPVLCGNETATPAPTSTPTIVATQNIWPTPTATPPVLTNRAWLPRTLR